jgi:flagellar assembly protein FliH
MADAPRKFMFDRSFDPGAAARGPERKPVTLKPEQYDALRKETFDAGFAAGQKAALDEQQSLILAALARVEERLNHAISHMNAYYREQDGLIRRLVLAIARKILPDFVSQHGTQEIQALLGGVIGDMVHEPRLVVRANETQFDAINARLQDIVAQKAYAGKVVVLADAAIAPGDCRIEWADGGIERKTEATWADIEKTIVPEGDAVPAPPDQGSR